MAKQQPQAVKRVRSKPVAVPCIDPIPMQNHVRKPKCLLFHGLCCCGLQRGSAALAFALLQQGLPLILTEATVSACQPPSRSPEVVSIHHAGAPGNTRFRAHGRCSYRVSRDSTAAWHSQIRMPRRRTYPVCTNPDLFGAEPHRTIATTGAQLMPTMLSLHLRESPTIRSYTEAIDDWLQRLCKG